MRSLSVLAMVMPFLPGFILIRQTLRGHSDAHSYLLQFSLALGLSIGISSCTYFLWLAKPFSLSIPYAVLEPLIFLMAAAFIYFFGKITPWCTTSECDHECNEQLNLDHNSKILFITFCLVLLCAAVAFLMVLLNKPHGGGDAYAIWNLRARFLFRGHDLWVRGFSSTIAWSHPDYPLLLPASIARAWTYFGRETTIIPQFFAASTVAGTAALLLSSLRVMRSLKHGLFASVFLIAASPFIRVGGTQYADVPIGFFILSAVVAFSLYRNETATATRIGQSYQVIALSGAMAGFAAWTKNEGLLFSLSWVIATSVVGFLWYRKSSFSKEISYLLIGLLPVLAVLFFFKIRYAPANDLLGAAPLHVLMSHLTDPSRYYMVAGAFCKEILHWGNGLFPILALFVLCTGIKPSKNHVPILVQILIVFTIVNVGYFFTYVLTPYDLAWHLGTSLERLLLQLWPTFLFAIFVALKPIGLKKKVT
jgi:hypothetical protein